LCQSRQTPKFLFNNWAGGRRRISRLKNFPWRLFGRPADQAEKLCNRVAGHRFPCRVFGHPRDGRLFFSGSCCWRLGFLCAPAASCHRKNRDYGRYQAQHVPSVSIQQKCFLSPPAGRKNPPPLKTPFFVGFSPVISPPGLLMLLIQNCSADKDTEMRQKFSSVRCPTGGERGTGVDGVGGVVKVASFAGLGNHPAPQRWTPPQSRRIF